MNSTNDGQSFVIKKATKEKGTQTPRDDIVDPVYPMGMPSVGGQRKPLCYASILTTPESCAYYQQREDELYQLACQLKGIRVEQAGDEPDKPKKPNKVVIRYTVEQMQSYNPYRFMDL